MAQDQEEWTTIRRKQGTRSRNSAGAYTHNNHDPRTADSLAQYPTELPNPEDADAEEVTRIHKRINQCRNELRNENIGEYVRNKLATCQNRNTSPNIKNAVAVGIGTLDGSREMDHWRSTWQMAVFLELCGCLKDPRCRDAVPMWLQEPIVNATDVKVLKDLRITVVPVPQAVPKIDRDTLLFAPFVEWSILFLQVLDGKDPQIYIGAELQSQIEALSSSRQEEEGDSKVLEESLEIAMSFSRRRKNARVDFVKHGGLNVLGLQLYCRMDDGK